jgi:phosphopantothenoylcysteine decarboxylase/phosphopantothenate--cysteine ligase
VTLIAANSTLSAPAGADVVEVVSADDMLAAVLRAAPGADAVVMAAAVADFKPASRAEGKIKKTDATGAPEIHLVQNPDILATIGTQRLRPGQVIVGFAAETHDVLANGQTKLGRKGADLLVVNQVGEGVGFEVDQNAAVILGADGSSTDVPLGSKDALADVVWDLVVARLAR